LVNQQQYEQAYTMLAENFKENSGVPTIDVYIQEWSKIGLATILAPIEVKQYGDTATATLVLVFPKSKKPLVRRYYLNHIQECNNLEFGCWQIVGKD
jgi:hypothetical protein